MVRTRLFTKSFQIESFFDYFFTVVAAIALLLNVYFTQQLGACDFSKLKIVGPYKVGVRYTKTRECKNELTVYYPVDNGTTYERKIKEGGNALWMRDPQKMIAALKNFV